MQTPGLLIVVDGIDGAGKTTLVDRLQEFFRCAGEPCIRSKEPTDGPYGQQIRRWAQNGRPASIDAELDTFLADRSEHVRNVIGPALASGKIVLLDRYYYSTIAYQAARVPARLAELRDRILAAAPQPDATIILDTAPEIGLHRIVENRGDKPNAFERLDDLRAVRRAFLGMADLPNVETHDAAPPAAMVASAVIESLLAGALKRRYCGKPWGCDGGMCGVRMAGECRWAELVRTA